MNDALKDTLFARAIAFAASAHVGHRRSYTGEPYILHPIEVAGIVRTITDRQDMLAAAVLHDVLEDTQTSEHQIADKFGADVLSMVKGLTDYPMPGKNRAFRKAASRDRLTAAPAEVQTIKYADLISNTASIVEHDPKFAKVYLAEKRALLDVMTKGSNLLHDRASTQVMHGLAALKEIA